ncbi:cyclin-dependent protein kinase inhibitor SIM [Syzygium oleosum]|uniref:cyclin-dependent protein kinase inhibitor SIM n=1 Tax=Syzygium oleosum TaxID=219896 RepID=UPI0011D1EE33|nr:cyclin-dependent protein kinase inhibitor SIM [Syzygium oleosum]
MATHLDPASEFGSPLAPVLPMLPPPLEARVGAAEADDPAAGEEECGTPTSRKHRIPPALTCPAAPRKPRARPTPAVVPCKRASLSEDRRLEFFEVTSRGEVERFFRSCGDAAAANAAKRRRFFCK